MIPFGVVGRSRVGRGRARTKGQALVEFTVVVPVFLFILTGMLEFGLAFSDKLTLGNATREGARVGAALATGSDTACSGDPAGVDKSIVASMQFILKSGGSDVNLAHITAIHIFKADSVGRQVSGSVNTWVYTPGAGPDADPGPGTETLDFSPSSQPWAACTRDNGSAAPDSIGVSIVYTYYLQTPLAAIGSLVGSSQGLTIPITDSTVMALNPTS